MKTSLPRLPSGARFCTLPDGSRHCTGSQMGRPDHLPALPFSGKFRLVRLRWVSGDYDEGGAYWGNSGGTSIYRALADDECALRYDETGRPEVFTRAANREQAKAKVRELIPGATFYR